MSKIKFIVTGLFTLCFWHLSAQNFEKKMDKMLYDLLDHSIEEISPSQLNALDSNIIILDCREQSEYKVGHIPNAIQFGYDSPKFELLDSLPKDKTIVTYCTVGYRSEKIAEKIQEKGFYQVYNLYGSIASWVNDGYQLYNDYGYQTDSVHCYSEDWSQWFQKGICVHK